LSELPKKFWQRTFLTASGLMEVWDKAIYRHMFKGSDELVFRAGHDACGILAIVTGFLPRE